jgi:uncharacterized protein (TIGR02118 family)
VIKVSVLYPHSQGAKFDMDYYLGQHIPLVQNKLGTALKGVSVEQGVAGGTPDAPPAFVAMGHPYSTRQQRSRKPSSRTPRRSWATFQITR